MKLPKRSELKDFDIERDITVSLDGDMYSALRSKDIHSGLAEFGATSDEVIHKLCAAWGGFQPRKIFFVSEND